MKRLPQGDDVSMEQIGRRERERRMRRNSILDAAEKIFARRGFRSTTMEEVARHSEFGMSTLYKFFNSKLELYSSVVEEKLSRLQEGLAQISETKLHWRKAVERFVSHHLQYFQENEHFFRIYMAEKFGLTDEPGKELEARIKARIADYVEQAESALLQWIEEGHLGSSGARAKALALLSTIETYLSRWMADGDTAGADERASLIMDIFFASTNGVSAKTGG